jgi:glycosyltransferase involved in cell wall biosynthesis
MLTVSLATCAYSDDRWDDLVAAVASARAQTRSPMEKIVVVDHNEGLLDRARMRFPDVRVIPNARGRGASGARNTAGDVARGDIIAFLDDDARATETWLEKLVEPFADPNVVGVGGKALPLWPAQRPRWLPNEFDWVVGCSYRGLPRETTTVRNLIGTNMSVRRDVMLSVGGFREGFGNVSGGERGHQPAPRLSTGEETEFCMRVSQRYPQLKWVYAPSAVVFHSVPIHRTTFRFFLSRCWIEGMGKATLAEVAGSRSALASERAYTLRVLPSGVRSEILASLRDREVSGVARAMSIVVGLADTSIGYVVGRVRATRRR